MATLSAYLKGLRTGDKIHPAIVDTLTNAGCVRTNLPSDVPEFFTTLDVTASGMASCDAFKCSYVTWGEGTICFSKPDADTELLSSRFMGCHLALLTDGRTQYGCHIHCRQNSSGDQKANWNNYMNSNTAQSVTLFQPDVNWSVKYRKPIDQKLDEDYDLWGIITSSGECYSVLVRAATGYIYFNYPGNFRSDIVFIAMTRTRSIASPYQISAHCDNGLSANSDNDDNGICLLI